MLMLLPHRARSVAAGVTGATAVLLGFGLLIFIVSLLVHLPEMTDIYGVLGPGLIGGTLLSVVAIAYVPNAAIWAASYAIGPGFAVGAGTSVAPSGVFVGMIPSFPPFAALPSPGPAPAISLLALAVPFAAGVVGGVLTIRALPSAVGEAAPLWGFVCGVLTGGVFGFLAALSGGPVGGQRMAVMGPSAWQVGLMAALEVGVSAAIAAWATNWHLLRRTRTRPADDAPSDEPAPAGAEVQFEDPEPVLANVDLQPLPDGVTPSGERHAVPKPRTEPEPGSVAPFRKRPPRDR
jgi:hypothetical protein